MSDTQKTTRLIPGHIYRVIWTDHYNKHQKTVGYRGKFLRWENRHCQLHGEFISREAVFHKIKESGRMASTCFSVDPLRGVMITEETDHAAA